jgi:hypothetical protein
MGDPISQYKYFGNIKEQIMNSDDDELFGESKLEKYATEQDAKESAIKQFKHEHPESCQEHAIQQVVITKIDIPFGNLIMFLVQLILAAIPAAIIASIFWWLIVIVIFGALSK